MPVNAGAHGPDERARPGRSGSGRVRVLRRDPQQVRAVPAQTSILAYQGAQKGFPFLPLTAFLQTGHLSGTEEARAASTAPRSRDGERRTAAQSERALART